MQAIITRTVSALATTMVLGLMSSAIAATPAEIASQAYRGQLKGIRGYQQLTLNLSSGRISVDDIIKAAGDTPTPSLRSQVQDFLNDYTLNK